VIVDNIADWYLMKSSQVK